MRKKVATAMFFLIASPTFASAVTVDELRAQINTLLAQIEQLKAQMVTVTANSQTIESSACLTLSRTLSRGSRGSDVASLQTFLGVEATGYFGPLTEKAVQQWQAKNNVISSGSPATTGYGTVGPRTRAAIASACTAPTTPTVPTTPVAPTTSVVPINPTVPTSPTTPPTSTACTPLTPQTQALSCPSGQIGSITQLRTSNCTSGATSPTWSDWQTTSNTCAVASNVSCTWSGQSVPSGQSRTAYQSPSVSFGQSCISETRICTNGSLSGSYQNVSCSVASPTYSLTNLRGGENVVYSRPYSGANKTYNYDPSVLYDNGAYHMYWCGGVAGDYILHAESTSLSGPWHAHADATQNSYDISLAPTNDGTSFDTVHTCDPTIVKTGGTYYLYYTGGNASGTNGAIGVASSNDGIQFQRLNGGAPIVSSAGKASHGAYGAGQQTVTFANSKYYMLYTDTTGAASLTNGAGQFLIRANDPLFQNSPETFTGSGFVALNDSTRTSYSLFNGFNVDLAYIPSWNMYMLLSHSDSGTTHVVLFDNSFSQVKDFSLSPTSWRDGPGLVVGPFHQALMSGANTVIVDFLRAVGTDDPYTWNLSWRGADLLRQ